MLYIYSGDVPELDSRLLTQLGSIGKLTVIPAYPGDHSTAKHITTYFRLSGFNAHTLPKAAYSNKQLLQTHILGSAAVYLCGGNTYEFLDFATNMQMFDVLHAFEADGGIIAAESAGSIILSTDISTAAIPSSYPDENNIGLEHFGGMGRLPFHINPHFDPKDQYCKSDIIELQALADSSNQPVLLLEDGEGFIMQDNKISFFEGREKYLIPDTTLTPQPSPASAEIENNRPQPA